MPGNEHTIARTFFLGFIKIHVLYHAAQEPVYGAALIDELAHHGYELSPGTLYPLLHHLKQEGFLECEKRVIAGRQRKYYTATPAGQAALAEVKKKIRELVHEVLEEGNEC
jgi:PadR family transcriptional regulator, regulatory protein PadR